MAEATSPATGCSYGVARVCRVWEVARSSFYAARQVGAGGTKATASPARRGPRPAASDQDLLAAIRADLARSPWAGEGHRKVWARLRALDGIRGARKRVLRLMREHALLSPHRARPRPEAPHEGHIITEAPNIMWAIDATQVTTVQDGKVWLFGVAEPETNGVIERLFRTLKEQAIHGRIFQTIEDVRDAVRAFVARYNAEWLVEKNGYRSPAQMRAVRQCQCR